MCIFPNLSGIIVSLGLGTVAFGTCYIHNDWSDSLNPCKASHVLLFMKTVYSLQKDMPTDFRERGKWRVYVKRRERGTETERDREGGRETCYILAGNSYVCKYAFYPD